MRKLALVAAAGAAVGALALPGQAAAVVPDPMLRVCAAVDSAPVVYCTAPVDCAVLGENDCFPTNYRFGLEGGQRVVKVQR